MCNRNCVSLRETETERRLNGRARVGVCVKYKMGIQNELA